jgi:hypothetical protein
MKYQQPLDQPGNPNAPYIDGNPAAGVQGSIVPAASIEFDQREIVEVIGRANSRGYKDFTDTPCAAPADTDLLQLRKAIEGFIRANMPVTPDIPTDLIDAHITFKVHGAAADFPDLIEAYYYLSKFKITTHGQVTLQLAAGQFTYTTPVTMVHPNQDRILVLGATMKAPIPGESGFAHNGSSSGQRATDTAANLITLRNSFATELRFQNCTGLLISGPTPMAIDAILVSYTGTANSNTTGIVWVNAQQGADSMQTPYQSGLATVGFGYGMVMANNGNFQMDTPATLVTLGNILDGLAIMSKAGIFHNGSVFSYSNGRAGIWCGHHSEFLASNISVIANADAGVDVVQGRAQWSGGHIYKNASFGLRGQFSQIYSAATDFGSGANVNSGGTIAAYWGSIICVTGSGNYLPTNPAFNTTANGGALITG